MSFTSFQRLLYFLLLSQIPSAFAVSISEDCDDWFSDVDDALTEARDIAAYAATRWSGRPIPRPGTLLGDMLGSNGEDDETVLNTAAHWFQEAVTAADSPNTLIHCKDTHLKPIGTTGRFVDNGNQVATGQTGNACGGKLRGFQYDDNNPNTGITTKIILLCSDSDNGALKAYKAGQINDWNQLGNLAKVAGPKATTGLGINYFASSLSYMILHELMHAADNRQSQLPGGMKEAYGYQAIVGLSPSDKQSNADSYALLGCGEYSRIHWQAAMTVLTAVPSGWFTARYYWASSFCRVADPPDRPEPPTTSGLKLLLERESQQSLHAGLPEIDDAPLDRDPAPGRPWFKRSMQGTVLRSRKYQAI
ncbi:MAG: hypothetical protein L6R37_004288 [Teloschistes peruensis]|nr:MAG: hypothetical protein L6R37_004288 [Teloschistes peruensis]